MYDSDSKGLSYTGGFFMLIGFTIAGLLVATVISIPVWTSMTGKSFMAMADGLDDPANGSAIKIIQCIQAFVGFFLPAVLTAFLLNRRPMNLIGFRGSFNWIQVTLIVAIVISALFVSGFLSYVNELIPVSGSMKLKFERMEKDYDRQIEAIVALNSFKDYVIGLVVIAFLPALCEETLFRGGLQNFLTRSTKMPYLSILIVSILFSAAHFSFYGFLPRFFLGVVLGLIYRYSGRIWLNIIAHFLNNAFALTLIYVYKIQGKPIKDSLSDRSPVAWGIVALPVLMALLFLFYRESSRNKLASFVRSEENKTHGI